MRRLPHLAAISLASIAAALTPALLFGILSWRFGLIVFVVAMLHAVVLGVPLYLLLRHYRKVNFVTLPAGGILVGALPITILTWPQEDLADNQAIFLFGVCGLLGALAFWAVLRLTRSHLTETLHDRSSVIDVGTRTS